MKGISAVKKCVLRVEGCKYFVMTLCRYQVSKEVMPKKVFYVPYNIETLKDIQCPPLNGITFNIESAAYYNQIFLAPNICKQCTKHIG
jgi:hypothetical protein